MAEPELDHLLINNIGDLESAAQRIISVLTPAIARSLNEVTQDFLRKAQWQGEHSWDRDDGSIWLAPEEWRKSGDHNGDDYLCQFNLEQGFGEGYEDCYWLTQIVGLGIRPLGLRWYRNDVGKRQWRKAVGQQTSIIATLRGLGFDYQESEGSFFLPVRIDQVTLAEAVRDESPELALGAFLDALRLCADSKPHFDALITATPEFN